MLLGYLVQVKWIVGFAMMRIYGIFYINFRVKPNFPQWDLCGAFRRPIHSGWQNENREPADRPKRMTKVGWSGHLLKKVSASLTSRSAGKAPQRWLMSAVRAIRDEARALRAIERVPWHALCCDTKALGVMNQVSHAGRSLKQLPAVAPGCHEQW